jgi:hypothetical protein
MTDGTNRAEASQPDTGGWQNKGWRPWRSNTTPHMFWERIVREQLMPTECTLVDAAGLFTDYASPVS